MCRALDAAAVSVLVPPSNKSRMCCLCPMETVVTDRNKHNCIFILDIIKARKIVL